MNHLFVLNPLFWKYRGRLLAGIVFVIAANWFRIKQPQLVRDAMDLVVAELKNPSADKTQLAEALLYFGVMVLLCAMLMGVFMYFMRQTIIVVSRYIEYDQRDQIFSHFTTLDTAFFKRNRVGDMMSRVVEDVNKVRMYVGPAIMYIVNTLATFVMVIGAMLHVSWQLTLISLVPLPILSFCIYWVSRLINERSTTIAQQLSTLTSNAQETFSGIRVIKSYTQEQPTAAAFEAQASLFREKSLDLVRINAVFTPLVAFLIGLSTVIVVYVGGILVMNKSISTGNIAEFIIYIGMLTWPVTSVGWVASLLQTANASQKRINEFLDIQPEIADAKTPITEPIQGHIEFRNVSFTYPDTGIQALKNVSFKVEKGRKLAIIGRTGSGKTTIAELLNRMYDATEGEILLDNRPIQAYSKAALRQAIGYVPQDVFLFSDTVENNILFGINDFKTQNPSEIASRAAEKAAIHTEILGLQDGYNTVVGERGVMLSGGQKQRISMARAIVKNPMLILFDDALSAVDNETENKILSYFEKELQNKTTIIITHRVHYLADFDKIIVIENGEVAENGTHEQLLAQAQYYAEQYAAQS
jgi:ATP-binding cassette, subfamily B, multidrug efflux pump